MTDQVPALFTPLTMRDVTLKNRIVVSPMCQYSGVGGLAQPWHVAHIGGMARSQPGLVIMEATDVEPAGMLSPGSLGLWTDEQEETLAKLVANVRTFSDSRIGIQLGHSGRKGSTQIPWLGGRRGEPLKEGEGAWQVCAPSAIPYDQGWQTPVALDDAGIERVKTAFCNAARRADRAGFDVVEIHGAHGYLLSSFFSPLSNKRTDKYGGSLENRMRLGCEVVTAVRKVLSPGKVLGIRINGSDWHDEGTTEDDAVEYTRNLKNAGVDYAVLSAGNVVKGVKIPPLVPGYMAPFADRVTAAKIDVKRLVVGLVVEPKFANELIATGRADMAGVGRAFLDNPHWPVRAAQELGYTMALPHPYQSVGPRWQGHGLLHRV